MRTLHLHLFYLALAGFVTADAQDLKHPAHQYGRHMFAELSMVEVPCEEGFEEAGYICARPLLHESAGEAIVAIDAFERSQTRFKVERATQWMIHRHGAGKLVFLSGGIEVHIVWLDDDKTVAVQR